jgi:hypothetical protein
VAPARLLLLSILASGTAWCHTADAIQVQVGRLADAGELVERVALSPELLLRLAPLDADGDGRVTGAELDAGAPALAAGVWAGLPMTAGGGACQRCCERASLAGGAVALEARFRCPGGEASQVFELLRVLPSSVHLELWGVDDEAPVLVQGPTRARVLRAPAPPGVPRWLGLGLGILGLLGGLALVRWLRGRDLGPG